MELCSIFHRLYLCLPSACTAACKKVPDIHGHHSHTAAGSVPLYSNLLGIETAVIAIAAMAVIAVTRTIINFIFFPPVSWWFPVY